MTLSHFIYKCINSPIKNKDGRLECWNGGIFEDWNIGMMSLLRKVIFSLQSTKTPRCTKYEILECCITELCESLVFRKKFTDSLLFLNPANFRRYNRRIYNQGDLSAKSAF